MSGRRPLKSPAARPYRYASHVECEESAETGGLHVVQPERWPPQKKRGMPMDDCQFLRCALCGCWVPVYPDNEPEVSGVRIEVPASPPAPADAAAVPFPARS